MEHSKGHNDDERRFSSEPAPRCKYGATDGGELRRHEQPYVPARRDGQYGPRCRRKRCTGPRTASQRPQSQTRASQQTGTSQRGRPVPLRSSRIDSHFMTLHAELPRRSVHYFQLPTCESPWMSSLHAIFFARKLRPARKRNNRR
jgi:hypothetical protein